MIFFIIATSILLLGFIYIGRCLISPLNISTGKKLAAWIPLLSVPLLVPFSYLLQRTMSSSLWGDVSGWIAYTALGFFSLVFFLLLTRDVARLIIKLTSFLVHLIRKPSRAPLQTEQVLDPTRRHFVLLSVNTVILGTSGLLAGYGFYEARKTPGIRKIEIPIKDLPEQFEGFRIAQFTDLHIGPTIKRGYIEKVVELIDGLKADVIAFTGDLADGTVSNLRNDVAPLSNLSAPCGCFFVTGNHEYYSGVEVWTREAKRMGFKVLINEHQLIERGESHIVLAGVTDYNAGRLMASHATDPAAAFEGSGEDSVRILLAHQPRSVYEASRLGCHLQLSGHTHGGQYIFWNALVPLQQPYVKGLHRHEDTWVYVSSGAGYWGPPLRVGVPSEVTLVILRRQNR